MSSYIQGKLMVGLPGSEVASSLDSLYEIIEDNRSIKLNGLEPENENISSSVIGFEMSKVDWDESEFFSMQEEFKEKKALFIEKFNMTPRLIATYYWY